MRLAISDQKIKAAKRLQVDILKVLELLDIMHTANEQGEQHFLDASTIMNCRNIISIQSQQNEELVSEPLRVKILSRLMREYRRTVEM